MYYYHHYHFYSGTTCIGYLALAASKSRRREGGRKKGISQLVSQSVCNQRAIEKRKGKSERKKGRQVKATTATKVLPAAAAAAVLSAVGLRWMDGS